MPILQLLISLLLQAVGFLGLAGAGGAGLALSLERAVSAADADRFAHAPHMHWPHDGMLASYDVKSIRRGYEVSFLAGHHNHEGLPFS